MDSIYKHVPDELILYSASYFIDSFPVPSYPIKWLNHLKRKTKNPWAIELLILLKIQDGKVDQAKQLYKTYKKILNKHLESYGRKELFMELINNIS